MKYDNEQLRDIIDNEGLGYAVLDYLNPNSIKDVKVRKMWLDARKALLALTKILDLD